MHTKTKGRCRKWATDYILFCVRYEALNRVSLMMLMNTVDGNLEDITVEWEVQTDIKLFCTIVSRIVIRILYSIRTIKLKL